MKTIAPAQGSVSPTRLLEIDAAIEAERIIAMIRIQITERLRRKGAVLGLSGGVDSSVCAALCVRAMGPERVLGLFMPERDCSLKSLELGKGIAEHLGIEAIVEDVSDTLEAAGCYRRFDDALRRVFPQYGPGCKSKIVLPALFGESPYRIFSAVIQTPDGKLHRRRLPLETYQEVVAATNFKQRVRKMMEYYHADRLRYAVVGTPNLLEYDQGFFVKNGDGSADLKPIAHLYKTQVYRLAEHLGIPKDVRVRRPTTDTYSLEQSQEEFFFSLPYDKMDLCLLGVQRGLPVCAVAEAAVLTEEQVKRVYGDIKAKRKAAEYLFQAPLLMQPAAAT